MVDIAALITYASSFFPSPPKTFGAVQHASVAGAVAELKTILGDGTGTIPWSTVLGVLMQLLTLLQPFLVSPVKP